MKKTLLFLTMLFVAVAGFADGEELGIYNRTDLGSFWRYDFRYLTTDTDGVSPITLSAAIFMHKDLYSKKMDGKGCILLNHYTITNDADRPTNVTMLSQLEGALTMSKYFIIESDGIGFGLTKDRQQPYLQGRILGKADIDAFLAGRKLISEEGFSYGDAVINMGYSQGGFLGAWVDRLVSEGYRSDELPKIDYTFIGGGSYDIYSTYLEIIKDYVTRYPVALPLVLWDILADKSIDITPEDVLTEEFLNHLQEWFSSKDNSTDSINAKAFRLFDSDEESGINVEKLFNMNLWDPNNAMVQEKIMPWMKSHSLTYEDWYPSKTDTITLVHSTGDEVVPFVNVQSLEKQYKRMGYTSYNVDSAYKTKHTPTGSSYVVRAIGALAKFKPKSSTSGISEVRRSAAVPENRNVYTLDGRLVLSAADYAAKFSTLPKGVYIINGRKVVK